MDFKDYISQIKDEVDQTLERYLPPAKAYPSAINRAMRYSIFAGGKRVRPVLLVLATEAVGGVRKKALPIAAAIEVIHTYTLIHDDLPAIDNDDLRRGMPTNHKKFGEAIAILAGDGLLTLAFEIISGEGERGSLPFDMVCRLTHEITKAVGVSGTIGGQVVDIESEEKQIDIPTLEYIHTHKTGKMIIAAVRAGAYIGNAPKEKIDALTTYAKKIGLAFQIVDDVLDIEGNVADLGKDIGSDTGKSKATYPSLLGMKESKKRAHDLLLQATDSLAMLGQGKEMLNHLAEYIVNRRG